MYGYTYEVFLVWVGAQPIYGGYLRKTFSSLTFGKNHGITYYGKIVFLSLSFMLSIFTLLLIKKGNSKAFRKLFDTYHAKVYHYVLRFTRNEVDAEDLTQKVFIQLWEKRNKIDPQRSFDAYIFTIAHHLACNFLKHKARVYSSITDSEEVAVSNTENLIYLNELSDLTRCKINQLPEKRQVIFKMHYDEHLSEEEIAQALHISIHTVRSQLAKASKSIRQFISDVAKVQASLLLFLIS